MDLQIYYDENRENVQIFDEASKWIKIFCIKIKTCLPKLEDCPKNRFENTDYSKILDCHKRALKCEARIQKSDQIIIYIFVDKQIDNLNSYLGN